MKSVIDRAVNSNRENSDGRLQIVEDGGKPIYNGLRVNDPCRPSGCIYGDPKYIVDRRYQCDQTSKVYKITCIECNSVIDDTMPDKDSPNYVGKTRTSIPARMSDHLDRQ